MARNAKEICFDRFKNLGRAAADWWTNHHGPVVTEGPPQQPELLLCGVRARRLIAQRLWLPRSNVEFDEILASITHSGSPRLAWLAVTTCSSPEPLRRASGLQTLASVNVTVFRKHLFRALTDQSEIVRFIALGGLKGLRKHRFDFEERSALMSVVRNASEETSLRFDALQILGYQGGRIYACLLRELIATETSEEMREEAARCLKEEQARIWRMRVANF